MKKIVTSAFEVLQHLENDRTLVPADTKGSYVVQVRNWKETPPGIYVPKSVVDKMLRNNELKRVPNSSALLPGGQLTAC